MSSLRADLPFILPQTHDNVGCPVAVSFPLAGIDRAIQHRFEDVQGASMASTASSLKTPLRAPNLNFLRFGSSSGTSLAIGMPDLAMMTRLPVNTQASAARRLGIRRRRSRLRLQRCGPQLLRRRGGSVLEPRDVIIRCRVPASCVRRAAATCPLCSTERQRPENAI